MNGCEHGFLVITLWPTFGAVQSIVLHLYPLLKVCLPVLTVAYVVTFRILYARPRIKVFSRQKTELRRSLPTNAHPGGYNALSLAIESSAI